VRDKISSIAKPDAKKNDIEWLFDYSFALARKLRLNIEREMRDILASMLFDAGRRDPARPNAFRLRMLRKHFHQLDIEGTVGLCLKIFGEVRVTHADLRPLGEAYRICNTLADIEEDFRAGYCNIPLEDMERLGINVLDTASPAVRKWCEEEAERGLRFLQEHRRRVEGLPLRILTRIVLPLFYERPARKSFNEFLRKE
jgi:phytoene/squalene synthetase